MNRVFKVIVELLDGSKVHKFIMAQNKYQAVELVYYREQMFKIQNNRAKYKAK